MCDELLGALGEVLLVEVPDVVAGREHVAVAGEDEAARVEPSDRLRQRVEDLVVQCAALGGVRDAQPRDVRSRLVEQQLAGRELGGGGAHSRTTSVSPSETDWPSSQRISATLPASSASTGISIFIDSRITSVSPSPTSWPTWHSIFQTVPVMWASTSGMGWHDNRRWRRTSL